MSGAAPSKSKTEPGARPDSARDPGRTIGWLALTLGVVWIAGALAIALALLGVERLLALPPTAAAALVAAALLPALMAWFSGAAAGEGARARAEASRLADAAERLLNPEQSAQASAGKLAAAVRAEIASLDRALELTLTRLKQVEGMVNQQARTVDGMADQAKAGAGQMISGMEREREQLLKISQDLNGQAQMIGDSISRHTQAISQAARQAEAEVRAADQALDSRLTSFGAAAALITDRTRGLSGAAQASADSALRLETALANALEVLAKATDLTDAARQSADAAAVAANSTASAVRETATRAIDDAKRVAELIRGEAAGVEREAAAALETLREAAEAAREAAVGARLAVEEGNPPGRARQAREPRAARVRTDWRNQRDALEAAPPPRPESSLFGEARDGPPASGWTWRELLSSIDEEPKQASSRKSTQPEPRPRAPAPAPRAADMIAQAGLNLDTVFSPSGLERIAQRARAGSQTRRRAVKDAAPEAVRRLSEHLAHDSAANHEAMEFLRDNGARIAELLARGRAAMDGAETRAFLLIDSAAG